MLWEHHRAPSSLAHLGTLGRTSSGCPKARCSLEPIFSKDWDKAFRDEQSPETSRNIQEHPETSRNIQKHPETSRNIQKHPETSKHHHSTDSTTSTCEKEVLRMVVVLMYEYNMYTWGRESSWYITISSSNAALVFDSYSKWFAVIAYLVLAVVPKVLPRLTT